MARVNDPIVLASASPRRAALLREMGLKFRVTVPRVEEITPKQFTPREIAQANAYRKAIAAACKHRRSVVIGADTVVALGKVVYGKPKDMPEAIRMIGRLQGRTHSVITGVCLVALARRKLRLFSVSTTVKFRSMTRRQIQSYLGKIQPLDKAGAYAIQEFGDEIVESVSGSYSNVVGLPVERLRDELRGFQLPHARKKPARRAVGVEKS